MAFLTIVVILRFLAWLKAVAKRETMDAMRSEYEDSLAQMQTVTSSGYTERQRAGREAQQRRNRRRIN